MSPFTTRLPENFVEAISTTLNVTTWVHRSSSKFHGFCAAKKLPRNEIAPEAIEIHPFSVIAEIVSMEKSIEKLIFLI